MANAIMEWASARPRTVIPGFVGRFLHSDTMTFALWEVAAGSPLPEHSHPHEQVVHLYEGEFEMTVDGETRRMKGGSVFAIPSNARHSGRAITDCRIMDVFCPVREDYREGTTNTIISDAARTG